MKEISNIENVKVCIVRAEESSGNVQFFVRAIRTDSEHPLAGILEYDCFQTKSGITEKQCVEYALFSVGFLLKFFGKKAVDLEMTRFTDENKETVATRTRFWRINA